MVTFHLRANISCCILHFCVDSTVHAVLSSTSRIAVQYTLADPRELETPLSSKAVFASAFFFFNTFGRRTFSCVMLLFEAGRLLNLDLFFLAGNSANCLASQSEKVSVALECEDGSTLPVTVSVPVACSCGECVFPEDTTTTTTTTTARITTTQYEAISHQKKNQI